MSNKHPKKQPNPVDVYIGKRVRMRRMMLSISQEKLSEPLGLTFQQVQKYEKGANRIGGSRLQQIATILKVPISFFYEGAPGCETALTDIDPNTDIAAQLLATRQGIALAKAFLEIRDDRLRSIALALVEKIADVQPAPASTAKAKAA